MADEVNIIPAIFTFLEPFPNTILCWVHFEAQVRFLNLPECEIKPIATLPAGEHASHYATMPPTPPLPSLMVTV